MAFRLEPRQVSANQLAWVTSIACWKSVALFCQYAVSFHASAMHAVQEAMAAAAIAGFVRGHFLTMSAAPHASITDKPTIGMYMYRSAWAWFPTCTNPMTG